MSRKSILIALVAGLIGFVAGNAFWYLASPLWIDRVVQEELPPELQVSTIATGTFAGADQVHRGAGTATIFASATGARVLRFADFKVTNGPDLKVWLVESENVTSDDTVTDRPFHSLGPLKGNIGDQTYPIPGAVDTAKFGSVIIWCEQFGVLFAAAPLKPAGS